MVQNPERREVARALVIVVAGRPGARAFQASLQQARARAEIEKKKRAKRERLIRRPQNASARYVRTTCAKTPNARSVILVWCEKKKDIIRAKGGEEGGQGGGEEEA